MTVDDVLATLYEASTDRELEVLDTVVCRAGLRWRCECGWINLTHAPECSNCGWCNGKSDDGRQAAPNRKDIP